MFSFNFITSSVLVLACLNAVAGSPAAALEVRQVAAPTGFEITNLGLHKACLPGTANYALSADKSTLTVDFSNYFARVGPGLPPLEWHRTCQTILDVVVPPGFALGISSVEYRGYYQLDTKVTASHLTVYYFKGPGRATAHSVLTGPISGGTHVYHDDFAPSNKVLSPCGTNTELNIYHDIRTLHGHNTAGSGYISQHDNPTFTYTFKFYWKTC
ncbi:hypothetical protein M413DRAFT_447670 [Hebeloma cylindrosporum]|uniref:Ubiquitin 3 binding protein But2 C-terminal domain-containing protein n=1 Tax=Hebeloma cylindrosporum TaxID=76867 RepID=A0A0C2XLW3_HEBCY|nr:hypothetical protein M413DRAFT_447670 [Hebeloma cylindrosporum h7]